jgi:hypothetical protein
VSAQHRYLRNRWTATKWTLVCKPRQGSGKKTFRCTQDPFTIFGGTTTITTTATTTATTTTAAAAATTATTTAAAATTTTTTTSTGCVYLDLCRRYQLMCFCFFSLLVLYTA